MSEKQHQSDEPLDEEARYRINPEADADANAHDAEAGHGSAPGRDDESAEDAPRDPQPEPSSEAALMEQLKQDVARLERDKLRAAADYQNLARRATLNEQVAREQVLLELARQLVNVLDHFDRALEHGGEASAESVLRGVTMVREELLGTLERFGIQRITAEPGEPFDPNRHEAMMRQPSDDVEAGHVVMQLQPGYALEEKTVRPTKVAIAE